MMHTNRTVSPFASTYTAPVSYGRPKRGTPDYAAKVRMQIARLAALHAASVAAQPPSAPDAIKSVLVVAACAQVRKVVRESLAERSWVRVTEVTSVEEAASFLSRETPDLVLVDSAERAVLDSPAVGRVLLIASEVPRSHEMPRQLVGMLARPLKVERVASKVLSLLETHG